MLKALTTSERLQKAGRRRAEQVSVALTVRWAKRILKIKRWRENAKNDTGSRKKRIPKIRFSNNIILLDAAARNDVDEGKFNCIPSKPWINTWFLFILVSFSPSRAHILLVRSLLLSGVDPNQGDDDGLTALHQSCIDDFEDVVRLVVWKLRVQKCRLT